MNSEKREAVAALVRKIRRDGAAFGVDPDGVSEADYSWADEILALVEDGDPERGVMRCTCCGYSKSLSERCPQCQTLTMVPMARRRVEDGERTVAGDCVECGAPVYHRPGKPGEYDHRCVEDGEPVGYVVVRWVNDIATFVNDEPWPPENAEALCDKRNERMEGSGRVTYTVHPVGRAREGTRMSSDRLEYDPEVGVEYEVMGVVRGPERRQGERRVTPSNVTPPFRAEMRRTGNDRRKQGRAQEGE